ncbi:MAG: T9SS type A sorting domain-containing protein [Prevotella sp.]
MLFLLVTSLSSMAQTNMVVHQTDGSSKQFDISSIRKLLVSPQTFSVYAQDESQIAMAQIRSVKFSQVSTGISNLAGSDVSLQRNGNMLTLEGLKAGDRVQLYSVNGQVTGNFDGKSLNLSTLNRGVYILKINNKTIKFVN